MDDDSLILSARETSTIMRTDNIYDEPTVAWAIGSDTFWEGAGYEDLLLEQIGEFSLQAGHHCVEVVTDENLEDGQYYLYMFNNNFTKCSSRGYDYSKDDNYYRTYSAVNDSDGELIQSLNGMGDQWWYRVLKYDYSGFWFK